MKILQYVKIIGKASLQGVLIFVFIQIMLTGCASTCKNPGVFISREATDEWHSYEILPNYHYYYAGPDSQPNYIIGIDDQYALRSKLWKPVDLTPEMLEKWINYLRPRVGYSQKPYGAYIIDPTGKRIGLWYSVRDSRRVGSARVGENYQVSVTIPSQPQGRKRNTFFCKYE